MTMPRANMFWRWWKEKQQKRNAAKIVASANAAIMEMATLIENNTSLFIDETRLPLDKRGMKLAFKIAIATERDSKRLDWLKAGWIMLADFQPGIGNAFSSPALPSRLEPLLAELDEFTKVTGAVAKESAELKAELDEWINNSNSRFDLP